MTDFTFHGHDTAHSIESDMDHVERYYSPGKINVVIYIGSCCGYEAGLIQLRYPHARVYAIEACRETFDLFLDKVRPCCPDSVITRCVAIGDEHKTATLYISPQNTCHSVLRQLDTPPESSREVQMVTLAEFCYEEGIAPDMLVLDVEGIPACILTMAGDKVLGGLKAVLAETEPMGANVFEYGDTDWEVDTLLKLKGFQRIVKVVPSEPARQYNSVWVRV